MATFDVINFYTSPTPTRVGGTITFPYPAARSADCYGDDQAVLNVPALQGNYLQDTDFTIAYTSSNIVVTWRGNTIPASSKVSLQAPLLFVA